ncbi:MAG: hypothetical protein L0027_07040, partial [Candidatus Rokubacteria bacterium]|nr:hypothetical protein [Candidatus Rokubacteria bacterium]
MSGLAPGVLVSAVLFDLSLALDGAALDDRAAGGGGEAEPWDALALFAEGRRAFRHDPFGGEGF